MTTGTAPAYGVRICCTIEDDPREGITAWIDLEEVENQEDVQSLIDCLTGRADDPYPDSWIEDGTFEVVEVRGMGPRLAAICSDQNGPLVDSLTDLAAAIQMLEAEEVASFMTWAEGDGGDWWMPGHAHGVGGQLPEDVVLGFRCSPTVTQLRMHNTPAA